MKLLGTAEDQLRELERSAPRLGQELRKYKTAEEARNWRITQTKEENHG